MSAEGDEEILRYPAESITLLTSCDACVAAFERILQEETAVGFDAEWKPVHVKGVRPILALFQIATSSRVYLLDAVALRNEFSAAAADKLRQIMASKTIRKLAFDLGQDLAMLGSLHPGLADVRAAAEALWDFKVFRDRSFDYLKTLYPGIDSDGPHRVGNSLAALIQLALGKTLPKSKRVRCSDWSRRPLTEVQKQYAALDAHCLLLLYDALEVKAVELSTPAALHLHLDNTSAFHERRRRVLYSTCWLSGSPFPLHLEAFRSAVQASAFFFLSLLSGGLTKKLKKKNV